MKEAFETKKFSASSKAVIELVNEILEEYAGKGYDLSLRQLYYQLVARGEIENTVQSYKRIGGIVNDGRMAGLIDWNMIQDRGRVQVRNSHWDTPKDILESAAYSFRIDKWADQPLHVMVMVEKQALEGVLIPVCRELDIPFIANKGYSSASTMYRIGTSFRPLLAEKEIIVLYLGDHDPSGIDMTRDVRERLNLFAGPDFDISVVSVDRLALNYDQVEQLNPPPNPAKETDSRYDHYVDEFGETCWELDAIEPNALAEIVRESVLGYRDEELWEEAVSRENKMKFELQEMAKKYRPAGSAQ